MAQPNKKHSYSSKDPDEIHIDPVIREDPQEKQPSIWWLYLAAAVAFAMMIFVLTKLM